MTTSTSRKATRTPLKVLGTIGVICLFGYFGYKLLSMDPAGYCRAQDRYISDEEFLKATIAIFDRHMNQEYAYPDGRKIKRKDSSDWFRKIDFNPLNPNCCLVQREETDFTFNRMFGLQKVVVGLNPKTSTLPIWASNKIEFYFDVCGDLMDSQLGLPDTTNRVITTKDIGE